MEKNEYLNYFNNDLFITKAEHVTASYRYTYKDSAYLRFCFLCHYFEIDICELRKENEYVFFATSADETHDSKEILERIKKEFFYDLPRSNKKNSFALLPYIDCFSEELYSKVFYGIYPEIRDYMRNILINDNDINNIIFSYENFISFLHNIYSYPLRDNENLDFYIESISTLSTQTVWKDVYLYPTYMNLSNEIINTEISNNTNYWNFVFENWDLFILLNNEPSIFNSFSYYTTRKPHQIPKDISSLYYDNDYSRTDLLLNNAEKYACLLSMSFHPTRRNEVRIQKMANEKIQTIQDKACFLFCKDNMNIIKKFKPYNIGLLFRIACLNNGLTDELPRIDLNEFINKIKPSSN